MNTTIQEKIKSDKILSKIAESYPSNKIYLVGGAVRDYFMNKISLDRDLIAADIEAKVFAEQLKKIFPSTLITLDEKTIYTD